MSEPTPAEIRHALERILKSRCFAHSERASQFLRFVVEETLAGSGSRLKGYTIGVEVFGRPPDFDPQADPLVRVEAGRLRSRLAEYYQTEGAHDEIEIELPRGGYAATWRWDRVEPPPTPPAPATLEFRAPSAPVRRPSSVARALAALLILALAVVYWQHRELSAARRLAAETANTMAVPSANGAKERPSSGTERPRIVVTPFENFSPEHPDLEPLAASITEEIMLALGRLDIRVVSVDRGRPASASLPEAGSRDYVLSGSVRLGEEKVRIAARITERATGVQVWNGAYDHAPAIESRPELQAAVALEVAAVALPYGPIFDAELARARSDAEPTLRDCVLRYLDFRRTMRASTFGGVLRCYQDLSLREPSSAEVWAGLAMAYLDDYGYRYGNAASLQASHMLAREAVERSLALDRDLLLGNMALARLQFFDGEAAQFRETVERVLEQDPRNAESRGYLGAILALDGDPRGIELVDEALAISPNQPGLVRMAYVTDHLRHGRWREALASAQRVETPDWFPAQIAIATSAALSGDAASAERARMRLLQLYPNFEEEAFDLFAQWRHDGPLLEALVDGLSRAGLELVRPPEATATTSAVTAQ